MNSYALNDMLIALHRPLERQMFDSPHPVIDLTYRQKWWRAIQS